MIHLHHPSGILLWIRGSRLAWQIAFVFIANGHGALSTPDDSVVLEKSVTARRCLPSYARTNAQADLLLCRHRSAARPSLVIAYFKNARFRSCGAMTSGCACVVQLLAFNF